MDNLTHSLFAITLGRTALGRAGRGTTAALVVASNAPDVDLIAIAGGRAAYLHWHRGLTHGPFGVVGLGLASAGGVWLVERILARWRTKEPAAPFAPFGMLAAAAIIGALFHVLMDLPTPYGTRLLSPFDWRWFSFDWMPIVDVYLLAALVVGVIFGWTAPASKARVAGIVLALMAADYGVRAVSHHQALVTAPRMFGPHLPAPCGAAPTTLLEIWPRSDAPAPSQAGRPCLVEIAAMPGFTSPFRWRVIARMTNAYELHELDLLDERLRAPEGTELFWRRAIRFPDAWSPIVVEAARTRTAQVFLGFSRFPAARSFVDAAGNATVRWRDIRFAGGILPESARQTDPFSVLVRLAPDGRVVEEAMGR